MATRDRRRYSQGRIDTIATTGNSDDYVIAPVNGILTEAVLSSIDALAQHGSNYLTFSITNLGQAGSGTNPLLAAVDGNTTKTTTGAAIAAHTKRSLTLNGTRSNRLVQAGDRLRIRAAATGTLAGTVTGARFLLTFEKEV